jgi:hypothetical protein
VFLVSRLHVRPPALIAGVVPRKSYDKTAAYYATAAANLPHAQSRTREDVGGELDNEAYRAFVRVDKVLMGNRVAAGFNFTIAP